MTTEGFDRRALPDPVEWMEREFYIPERRGPIKLAEYQKACLREALSIDKYGKFKYSVIVWSDLKKSAKTTIAAGVMCWLADNRPFARIRLVGNDLDQADARVFNAIRTAVELNPSWARRMRIVRNTIHFPNRSTIQAVAVDPGGESGGNDDAVEWTELCEATRPVHEKMFNALTLSPTKFGESFFWTDTYAGHTGESVVLERLYEQGLAGEHIGARLGFPDLPVHSNPSARLFMLWNNRPRLPWLTDEYYASQAQVLPPDEMRRIHGNEWVSSTQKFVPIELWNSCRGAIMPFAERQPVIFALDGGYASDPFAIVGTTKFQGDDKIYIFYARIWTPPVGGKLEFADVNNPANPEYPEGEIRRLAKAYRVLEFAFDNYQLHDMTTRLRKQRVGNFAEFSQAGDRLIADKQLHDMIVRGGVIHDGNEVLTEHIGNANAKVDAEGSKLRIVKRTASRKIDAAVCASMACAEWEYFLI